MILKEMRIWINQLPPDLDNYDVIIRDWSIHEDNFNAALDKPIVTCYIDDKNNEVCLLDQVSHDNFEKIN
jgi:hypothetical protein